ncbi:hypothetical protein [Alicyclobacillus macrosporangiidus]|nr:hypothetical protein [Alicyclobacillus macrosporangiidus]
MTIAAEIPTHRSLVNGRLSDEGMAFRFRENSEFISWRGSESVAAASKV